MTFDIALLRTQHQHTTPVCLGVYRGLKHTWANRRYSSCRHTQLGMSPGMSGVPPGYAADIPRYVELGMSADIPNRPPVARVGLHSTITNGSKCSNGLEQ